MPVTEERLLERIDKLVDSFQTTNLNLEKNSGEIRLVNQRLQSLEMMQSLNQQVTDKKIQDTGDVLKKLDGELSIMRTQIARAQLIFAFIASIAMIVVGFAQKLFFDYVDNASKAASALQNHTNMLG